MGLNSLLLASLLAVSTTAPATDRIDASDWDARAAEHLLNRAGFGGSALEVERLVALGPEAAVASLFLPVRQVDPYFVEHDESYRDLRQRARQDVDEGATTEAERAAMMRAVRADFRRTDRRQMASYTDWWIERMIEGDDPLRDRMTLFWAGLFTSSYREVKSSPAMIEQHQLLRDGALGSYASLLRSVARDPAMLEYLDAASNRKSSPNENFARELLELFSLGEGHYTEADVVAAARAFTGWTDRRGAFVFNRRQHDRGEKTFLGETGRFDGDDVLDIVLSTERCSAYVAGRLLEYFEGRPADDDRVSHYAALLRASDYDVRPVLEALFLDPDFYADDVVGQRIASPIDLLVGQARRLGVEPPSGLLATGASTLGQTLFGPPSVKGWDEGRAWITTTTIMQRGNLSGVLVGTVGSQEFLEASDLSGGESGEMSDEMDGEPAMRGDEMEPRSRRARRDDIARLLGRVEDFGWRPTLYLSARAARAGARTDAEVVDVLANDLLAVGLTDRSRAELIAFLVEEREATSLPPTVWEAPDADVEHLTRRLVHLMLSMPEGQLH